MSKYFEKLVGGDGQTPEDWKEHLLEAHRKAPSMSPAAFADCRSSGGQSSYDWLAEELPTDCDLVLDLGCGDGFLIPFLQRKLSAATKIAGIDMSEAELRLAEKRGLGKNVTLRRAEADATGLAAASVDAVLCHMAFMLMLPIESVVAEILRVLKPGGIFAAVVSGRPGSQELFAKIRGHVGDFFAREFPKMTTPLTGDPRVQTESGLREVLAGFDTLTISSDTFLARLSPQEVWDHIKNMYIIGSLPEPSRSRLEKTLVGLFESEEKSIGSLVLDFPATKFVATKKF